MTKCALLTHSHTKRITAAALTAAKARRDWSNGDLADAMGCGEGTIRNRLTDDEPSHQMTVHELRRVTQADGPMIANAIFADLEYQLVPDNPESAIDALTVAHGAANCAAALIEASPGGISVAEWRTLMPILEAQDQRLSSLIQAGRAALAGVR